MKIIVVDLDDTLYDYKQFLHQGFVNVSSYISKKNRLNQKEIIDRIYKIYNNYSESKTFHLLKKYYQLNFSIKKSINIYRYSERSLKLYKDSILFLNTHFGNIYLVTDGNKIVQKNKILSLKIKKYFKKIYITNQYGKKFNKPSLYCFKLIKLREKCNWQDMIYIGDNKKKDFINLNKKGANTIRINRGIYKNLKVKRNYEAKRVFSNFYQISKNLTY